MLTELCVLREVRWWSSAWERAAWPATVNRRRPVNRGEDRVFSVFKKSRQDQVCGLSCGVWHCPLAVSRDLSVFPVVPGFGRV